MPLLKWGSLSKEIFPRVILLCERQDKHIRKPGILNHNFEKKTASAYAAPGAVFGRGMLMPGNPWGVCSGTLPPSAGLKFKLRAHWATSDETCAVCLCVPHVWQNRHPPAFLNLAEDRVPWIWITPIRHVLLILMILCLEGCIRHLLFRSGRHMRAREHSVGVVLPPTQQTSLNSR